MRDDAPAFNEFVAARGAALSRTAYLLTGDHHLAEDLLQTALMQAARHWRRIEGQPEAYVRRCLYNQNISWWRRRRITETALGGHDVAAAQPDADLRLTLEDALRRLSPRQRTVVVLRYFEDLTESQTAQTLGIGLGTVKSTHRDAILRLRRLAPELADLTGRGGTP